MASRKKTFRFDDNGIAAEGSRKRSPGGGEDLGGRQRLPPVSLNIYEHMSYTTSMKLSEWAEQEGIHYQTAWRWFGDGQLPVPATQTPSGTILVDVPRSEGEPYGRAVVYARVSSHDQRSDLDPQVARTSEWATAQGMTISDVVSEVGPGMNGRAAKLARLLADATVVTIVVEHRDRLARFGVENVEAALSAQGRRVMVADPGEMDDDLVREQTQGAHELLCSSLWPTRCPQPGREGAQLRQARYRANGTSRCKCVSDGQVQGSSGVGAPGVLVRG